MSDRTVSAALVATSLAGVAVTAYLLSVRLGSAELLCSTGGCETVQRSSYAELVGIPVAALGLGAYLVVGATGLLAGPLARAVGAGVALASAAIGAYLLVVQRTVLDAVCDWCLASDALLSLVAVLALLRLRGGLVPAPA
jgi:uncharacterized membrane protein